MAYDDTGGIPVEPDATLTSLATGPGQVRYGDTLLGSATPAGLRALIGWRDLPDVELGDTARPQGHGSYPGSAYGGPLSPSAVFLLRGTLEAKTLALAAIERATRLDGVERPLIVNDGTGATYRMARVVARSIPQDVHFQHAPVEVSVQWNCADPRRYGLESTAAAVRVSSTTGGLGYPLDYPLDYGTTVGNSAVVSNTGTSDSHVVVSFAGPLTRPRIVCSAGWALEFDTPLAAGETLTANALDGTVLLDGADRLYTITPTSDPLEACTLPPGESVSVGLSAESGTGTATVTYRPAYL